MPHPLHNLVPPHSHPLNWLLVSEPGKIGARWNFRYFLVRDGIFWGIGTWNGDSRPRSRFWWGWDGEKEKGMIQKLPGSLKTDFSNGRASFGSDFTCFFEITAKKNVDLGLDYPFLDPIFWNIPPRTEKYRKFRQDPIIPGSLTRRQDEKSEYEIISLNTRL